jgi:DNA-directed RNA polymerase specialized sigma24 family protein
MVAQFVTAESLSQAFITATLLTGSERRGEVAVLEAIRAMEGAEPVEEEMFQNTLVAAVALGSDNLEPSLQALEQAYSTLPIEVLRVMRIPHDLRQCFVLRVLAGMPSENCGRLLNMDVAQVDQTACLAAQALGRIVQAERAA